MNSLDSYIVSIGISPEIGLVISRDTPSPEPEMRILCLLLYEFRRGTVCIAAYIERNGSGCIPENLVICRPAASVSRSRAGIRVYAGVKANPPSLPLS